MSEDFGAFLKHERELRGVPLDEISEVTKIHKRYLVAMEENHFDDLPGEVFVKGYIRAYAKILGSNPEEMINTYDLAVGRGRRELQQQNEIEQERKRTAVKNRFGFSLLALIVLGSAGLGTWLFMKKPDTVVNSMTSMIAGEEMNVQASVSEPAGFSSSSTKEELQSESADNSTTENEKNSNQNLASLEPQKTDQATDQGSGQEGVSETVSAADPQSPASEEVINSETVEAISEPAGLKKPSQSSEKEVIIQKVPEKLASADVILNTAETGQIDITPLKLTIQVEGNSWFNITVDGSREEDFILPSGTSKSFNAENQFQITIGNKDGTTLLLNDQFLEMPYSPDNVVRNYLINSNLIVE